MRNSTLADFSALKMSFHYLLACIVSEKKSALINVFFLILELIFKISLEISHNSRSKSRLRSAGRSPVAEPVILGFCEVGPRSPSLLSTGGADSRGLTASPCH